MVAEFDKEKAKWESNPANAGKSFEVEQGKKIDVTYRDEEAARKNWRRPR